MNVCIPVLFEKKPFLPFYFTKPNTFDNLLEFDLFRLFAGQGYFLEDGYESDTWPDFAHNETLFLHKHFRVQTTSKPNHDRA